MPNKDTYKKLKMGICDEIIKDNDGVKHPCDGNIQFDKKEYFYYCMDCHKTWNEISWDSYMLRNKEEEYHIPDVDENLEGLNNL